MSVSLLGSVNTCKVSVDWASRVQSDRFLNPNNMTCYNWNGVDSTGRRVCPDSFYTKAAGCNSALDRAIVENGVTRPQYMEYVTLSANGIQGDIYGDSTGVGNGNNGEKREGFSLPQYDEVNRFNMYSMPNNFEGCVAGTTPYQNCVGNVNNITGNFGIQFSKVTNPTCGPCRGYELGQLANKNQQYAGGLTKKGGCGSYPFTANLADMAKVRRTQQNLNEGFYSNQYKKNSGF